MTFWYDTQQWKEKIKKNYTRQCHLYKRSSNKRTKIREQNNWKKTQRFSTLYTAMGDENVVFLSKFFSYQCTAATHYNRCRFRLHSRIFANPFLSVPLFFSLHFAFYLVSACCCCCCCRWVCFPRSHSIFVIWCIIIKNLIWQNVKWLLLLFFTRKNKAKEPSILCCRSFSLNRERKTEEKMEEK